MGATGKWSLAKFNCFATYRQSSIFLAIVSSRNTLYIKNYMYPEPKSDVYLKNWSHWNESFYVGPYLLSGSTRYWAGLNLSIIALELPSSSCEWWVVGATHRWRTLSHVGQRTCRGWWRGPGPRAWTASGPWGLAYASPRVPSPTCGG